MYFAIKILQYEMKKLPKSHNQGKRTHSIYYEFLRNRRYKLVLKVRQKKSLELGDKKVNIFQDEMTGAFVMLNSMQLMMMLLYILG